MKLTTGRLLVGCLLGGVGFVIAFCAGIVRPPRPMFCDNYAAGGFEVVPMWQPNTPFVDGHGHWLWIDQGDNLVALQATGKAERRRSHALSRGLTSARFRLGGPDVDEQYDRHVTIPRARDALVVILPDGRWQAFPSKGQARPFFLDCLYQDPIPNLLSEVATLLDADTRGRFDEFIRGYSPP